MKRTCLLCSKYLVEEINFSSLFSLSKVQQECLCTECRLKFISLDKSACCTGCGRVWLETWCTDCQRWHQSNPDIPLAHSALYEYNDWMKEWMEQFKFKGDYRLANVFSIEIKKQFTGKQLKNLLIVPIPISFESYQLRGFNQVEALLDFAGIPYHSLLENQNLEKKQSTKNRQERLRMEQPFILKDSHSFDLAKYADKSVVLVDDVYTTGRTILHAKKLILELGLTLEKSLSIAR
ncbi:ComF family protein [Carnobacterium gallinarum]|uniref:ComF family protein n=1 Tax=Carnobacterium gallinarum TaxID=2749 RepID=UPI0005520B82|nr:phosphoribosyltransferase family protein [Carnobacterium gallinarum]